MDPFFHFPIFYDAEKIVLSEQIQNDLELLNLLQCEDQTKTKEEEKKTKINDDELNDLIENIEEDNKNKEEDKREDKREKKENMSFDEEETQNVPIYEKIFQPRDEFETVNMFNEASKYYTTNVDFLKDYQTFLKQYKHSNSYLFDSSLLCKDTNDEKGKQEKYQEISTGGQNILSDSDLTKEKKKLKHGYKIIEDMFQETMHSYFLHKYGFIDFSFFQHLNQYDIVLQSLSLYNLFSPLLSVLVPVIMFLTPFYILKIQMGTDLTFEKYFSLLREVGGNQPLIRFITGVHNASNEQRFYMLVTIAFYVYSMYKSWIDCLRFHQNIKQMHLYIVTLQGYLELTIRRMRHIVSCCHMLPSFSIFNQVIAKNLNILLDMQHVFSSISSFSWSSKTIWKLGYTMRCFYQLSTNNEFRDALIYSFGFHGFFHMTETLKRRIDKNEMSFISSFYEPQKRKENQIDINDDDENKNEDEKDEDENDENKNEDENKNDENKNLNKDGNKSKSIDETKEKKDKRKNMKQDKKRTFSETSPKILFSSSFYPGLFSSVSGDLPSNVAFNNINIDKHWVITGPNASGKTTLIKSVLINIIFSQQYGCGFFKSGTLTPFHSLFCYLNVPDTSGRDSLFQAEARRCKQIIDHIQLHPQRNHFGIFDELYSGTNPEEAAESSFCFMRFLSSFPTVRCMLTTHFIQVCKQIQHNEKASQEIDLKHMKVEKKINHGEQEINLNLFSFSPFRYLYKVETGVSTIKGAFVILNELNYPKEMLDIFDSSSTKEEKNKIQETDTDTDTTDTTII